MKTSVYRRIRHRAHTSETAQSKKEGQQEKSFFGENTHDPFFKPANGISAQSVVQLKSSVDSSDNVAVQRVEDKKEEDKIQKKNDDLKIQRQNDAEEEEIQMKAEEEEEEVQMKAEEEEEQLQMKSSDKEEEDKVQKKDSEKEKEDKKIQRKESPVTSATSPVNYIHSLNGKGKPLSPETNHFFSSRIGYDFSKVKIHKDKEAADSAKGLNAKAYTVKNNVVFGEGQYNTDTIEGKKLLAHELTHVVQQSSDTGKIQTQAVLTPAQELAAIQFNRRNYDERSIRIIQIVTGTGVDGVFGSLSARAVAAFQHANGIPANGQVDEATINAMIPGRVAADRREHIVQLVVDFFNIPTTDTLSIHFDPSMPIIPLGATDFEPGNVRIIRLSLLAFLTAGVLRNVINAQLAVPAPALPPLTARPAVLNPVQELAAIQYNGSKYTDKRSIRIVQGFVQANPDGLWGRDTVQRIAQYQHDNGLTEDGKVGHDTLSQISDDLIAAGNEDSSIRLIIDFYNLRDSGNLLDVFYDPTETANASTDFRVNEPVRVRVGPSGINQPFEGLVHTIAHEFEHVRRLKQGIVAAATHEFLGESIEILSVGMTPEDLESVARGTPGYVAGFADDAGRCLNNWNAMPVADRRRFRAKFVAVRNVVRRTVAAGTPVQRALHAPLVARYNAVVLP